MQVQAASPGGPSTLLGFKERLGSIDPRRSSPPTAPPSPAAASQEDQQQQQQPSRRMSMRSPAGPTAQQQQRASIPGAVIPMSEGDVEEEEPERGIVGQAQMMEELLRVRDTFVCQGWGELLAKMKAGKTLEDLVREEKKRDERMQNKVQQQDAHLQEKFQVAEADINGVVQAFCQEHARQGQEQEALLRMKAGVEALLGTLEEAQGRIIKEEETVAGQQGEQDEEEEEAAEQEGQEQVRQSEAATQAADAEQSLVEKRVRELKARMEQLQAGGATEQAEMEADDLYAATLQDETDTLSEATRLREQAATLTAVLQMLQGLYNVTVTVFDEAEAGQGEMVLRLVYPSKHALEMTLSTGGTETAGVSLQLARLEVPPTQQRRKSTATADAQRLMMNQVDNLVTVAQGLPAPLDLLFLAREVGWMVASRGVAKMEIRELMKRYIVKHNEAMDELTVTFAEGVVASFSLLGGYPHMPGSVRIAGLVGVGGWKDGELAVTSRSLNGLGLDSLSALVDALHERIVELDGKAE